MTAKHRALYGKYIRQSDADMLIAEVDSELEEEVRKDIGEYLGFLPREEPQVTNGCIPVPCRRNDTAVFALAADLLAVAAEELAQAEAEELHRQQVLHKARCILARARQARFAAEKKQQAEAWEKEKAERQSQTLRQLRVLREMAQPYTSKPACFAWSYSPTATECKGTGAKGSACELRKECSSLMKAVPKCFGTFEQHSLQCFGGTKSNCRFDGPCLAKTRQLAVLAGKSLMRPGIRK